MPGVVAPGDWPTYLGSGGDGFNPYETTITPANAGSLKVKWKQTGASVINAQPTVANGMIFWGDWYGNEHATSLAGTALWSTNLGRTWPGVPDPCGYSYNPNPGITSTASVTNVNGQFTVFVGGGDGQLYALNAYTGAILWHTRLGTYRQGFVWGSPAVYNGSVYVSLASFSDCPLVQGRIIRLNAATGAIQNIFKVVPDGCTGGTVFGSVTVDAVGGYVYFASGGLGGCGKAEPYTSSIVKLRASDLGLVSYWQVPASQQAEDGDFGNTPILFWSSSGGTTRLMVGVMHKDGIFFALDRDHISSGPVWERSVSFPAGAGIYAPAAFDGHRVYVTGTGTSAGNTYCANGAIRALDPANGAIIWGRCLTSEGPTYGPASVIPGIVVVGAGPWTVVLSSDTGATLYEYKSPAGQTLYGGASISHGVIYQGDRGGTLTAFGL